MEYLQRIDKESVEIGSFNKFGVIGDPGCDGLGTCNLKQFALALEECSDMDFVLVVGDLVPTGSGKYYKEIRDFINKKSTVPVYVLPGNHDTGEYEKYLGLQEYVIVSGEKALVVLNNMNRGFTAEGLSMLKRTLAKRDIKCVYIAFHIPIPNNFSHNTVSAAEADRLLSAISAHKDKVRYFICGHVHSRFTDIVWDIPLICTGGGGAVIEDVSENITAAEIDHHVFKFYENHQYKIVDTGDRNIYLGDNILENRLEETVKGELMAHLKYLMYADNAESHGLYNTAQVFRALAASEYRHARNFFALLDNTAGFSDFLKESIRTEKYEYDYIYKMTVEYSSDNQKNLSVLAYENAMAAEKEHAKLLGRISTEEDYKGKNIYVCPICGFVMEGDNPPDRCPVCGRPSKVFEGYELQQ